MRGRFLCFAVAGLLAASCTVPPPAPKTQLQAREYQTRTFDVADAKVVLKAMVDVLQDDGYMLKDANTDLGLLSAAKEMDVESKGEAFVAALFAGNQARWAKNTIIEATANCSAFGKQTRVRVTFQLKKMNNKGEVMEVKLIEDPQHYQDFFAKVDKGIFLATQGL